MRNNLDETLDFWPRLEKGLRCDSDQGSFQCPTLWSCSVVLNKLISQGRQSLIDLVAWLISAKVVLYLLPTSSRIDVSACVCENSQYRGLFWVARQAISSIPVFSLYAFVRIPDLYLDFQAFYLMWPLSPRLWPVSTQLLLLKAWKLSRRFLWCSCEFLILLHWILRV